MTRDLYIRTKTDVRRYTMGRNVRPLTIVEKRLYRTDPKFMIHDRDSDHEFIMYDKDGTQPYYTADETSNPDFTMAYIDIAKAAGKGQAATKLGKLTSIPAYYILYGIVGLVIVYAVLTGGIV